MGLGSSFLPPWVNAEKLDEEKKKQKTTQDAAKIEALEKESEALKKRIKQLEDELRNLKQ